MAHNTQFNINVSTERQRLVTCSSVIVHIINSIILKIIDLKNLPSC